MALILNLKLYLHKKYLKFANKSTFNIILAQKNIFKQQKAIKLKKI